MKIFLITSFLFFGLNVAIGQLDTVNLYKTLKVHVLLDQNNGIIDFDKLSQTTDLSVIKLKSKGFEEDVNFFAIVHNFLLEKKDSSIDKSNLTPFECYYIMAYNAEQDRIYHLKGFINDDFMEFYLNEIPYSLKSLHSPRLIVKDGLNDFEIENLDIKCLYNYYIENRKKRNDCLISCVKRDDHLL